MELFECHHDISGDTWCKLYRSWLQASSYLSAFFFEVVYSLRTSRQSWGLGIWTDRSLKMIQNLSISFSFLGPYHVKLLPRSFGIVSVLPCPPQQQVPSVSDFKSEERKVSAARPIRLGNNGHKVLKATDWRQGAVRCCHYCHTQEIFRFDIWQSEGIRRIRRVPQRNEMSWAEFQCSGKKKRKKKKMKKKKNKVTYKHNHQCCVVTSKLPLIQNTSTVFGRRIRFARKGSWTKYCVRVGVLEAAVSKSGLWYN